MSQSNLMTFSGYLSSKGILTCIFPFGYFLLKAASRRFDLILNWEVKETDLTFDCIFMIHLLE